MVLVENVHTKVQSEFTDAEWANVQAKNEWKDTFRVIDTTVKKNVPKELADLEAAKVQTADAESKPADTPAAAKADKPVKAQAADKKA